MTMKHEFHTGKHQFSSENVKIWFLSSLVVLDRKQSWITGNIRPKWPPWSSPQYSFTLQINQGVAGTSAGPNLHPQSQLSAQKQAPHRRKKPPCGSYLTLYPTSTPIIKRALQELFISSAIYPPPPHTSLELIKWWGFETRFGGWKCWDDNDAM